MPLFTTRHYFLALSCTAGALLWGVGTLNGSMVDLTQTAWLGRFGDGSPLYNRYTGLLPIDFPLAVLVAFFHKATNGSDREAQLFLIDVFASVQPGLMWFAADSIRFRTQATNPWIPLCWGMLCQVFGAGLIFPLYFMFQLESVGPRQTSLEKRQKQKAYVSNATLPVSYLLGGILPWILIGFPSQGRRSSIHQQLLALFQLGPIWFSCIQMIGMKFWKDQDNIVMSQERRMTTARYWMKTSYIVAILPSAIAHLYVVANVVQSDVFSFTRMYVPFMFSGPVGVQTLALSGPWLFLQYDYIIITISSISWAYVVLSRAQGPGIKIPLLLWLAVGTLAFGSGAVASFAMYLKEGMDTTEESDTGELFDKNGLSDMGKKLEAKKAM